MNAVETLEAAITKLEALKATSIPGPWSAPKEILGLPSKTIFGGDPARTHEAYVAAAHDGELIVTLHRTIDAQLAILRAALSTNDDHEAYRGNYTGRGPLKVTPLGIAAVNLAHAILGDS